MQKKILEQKQKDEDKKNMKANNTTTQHEISHDLAVAMPAMVFSLIRFLLN